MSNIPWSKLLGKEWAVLLNDYLQTDEVQDIMNQTVRNYNNSIVYPPKEDLFRAFRLTPPSKIKVVILGQDPYHNGRATGLAFANSDAHINLSPSVASIRDAVEKSLDLLLVDFDWTLESWAKQGVFLLNTALTVRKGSPGSHTYWHSFTRNVVEILASNTTSLHFCFWGSYAKKFSDLVGKNRHFCYFASHPIAHIYNPSQTHWQCNHFKEINQKIIETNGSDETISWEDNNPSSVSYSRTLYQQ